MNAAIQSALMKVSQGAMPLVRSRTGRLLLGLLLGGPHVLFLLLAVASRGHFSWNVHLRATLLLALVILALEACLFYGFFGILLILWRLQSSVFVPDLKTARLLLSYSLMPVIYGLLFGWGLKEWAGLHSPMLFRGVLLLYGTYWVGTSALIFKIALNNALKVRRQAKSEYSG